MKKIFVFIVLILSLSVSGVCLAQDGIAYERLMLKLSKNSLIGTGRSMAMGGAFGALGADVSTMSVNPAGLGVYRSSEYTITPSLKYMATDGVLGGTKVGDTRTHMNIHEFGIVSVLNSLPGSSKLVSVNLGFGINRLADFYNSTRLEGYGIAHSKTDAYVFNSDGIVYKDFLPTDLDEYAGFYSGVPWQSVQAWETGLMQSAYNKTQGVLYDDLYESVLAQGDLVDQFVDVRERGRIDEYTFSVGFNVNNTTFWGLTMGYQDLLYEYSLVYGENFYKYARGSGFDEFQDYRVEGNGLNFKLGMIVLPTDRLRLGLAAHTPTWISLGESYFSSMSADLEDLGIVPGFDNPNDPEQFIYANSEPDYPMQYDFDIRSPWRFILSSSYVLGSKGIVSIDYEFTNYTWMKYSNSSDAKYINKKVSELYKSAHTVRLGGEYRLSPSFLLRGGYAFYGSPWNKNKAAVNPLSYEDNQQVLTAGVGYRVKNWFFDLAYVSSQESVDFSVYQYSKTDVWRAKVDNWEQRFALTIGVRL